MYLVIPRHHPPANLNDSSSSQIIFEGSARLDNRLELARSLGVSPTQLSTLTDENLVLESYIKWDQLCVNYLLGDFAFVVFDPTKSDIFCARDHIGIAPFYYYFSKENFVFADNIRELVEGQLVPAVLDDDSVCCYLRDGELYHREKTFYRDVKKLPPGHTMLICGSELYPQAYWSLENCGAMEFKSQRDCSDQLHKLLIEAVATRLPKNEPFGMHLSGGLDSSGIAAICRKDLKTAAEDIRAYTWNYEPQTQLDLSLPEVSSLLAVAENLGVPLQYSNMGVEGLHALLCNRNISYGDTTDCWSEWSVRDHALTNGVTTILSGWGGDQFISHHGTHRYVDLVVTGKPITAMVEIWRAVKPSPRPLRRFFSVVRQLVLSPILSSMMSRVPSRAHYFIAVRPDIKKLASELPSEISGTVALSIRDDQLNAGNNLHLLNRIESWSAACGERNLAYTYPLLDKRVVEFAMGMASSNFCHNGITRYTFRDAIKDLLPENIVYSSHKREPERAQRDLSVCITAVDKWKKGRSGTAQANRFIDEGKLHSLIDDLQKTHWRNDDATFERVGAIIRSIFVINLCEQAAASS